MRNKTEESQTQMKIIRTNPLFEIYIENDVLIINNKQHSKDNRRLKIEDIESIELIRKLSLLNKFIEQTFGFLVPAKSELLRIRFENGFKDILVTDCDSKKVESLVYEVNLLILKIQNHKS
nr:hypothetical protein [uncultured Flavobacterium sp.]